MWDLALEGFRNLSKTIRWNKPRAQSSALWHDAVFGPSPSVFHGSWDCSLFSNCSLTHASTSLVAPVTGTSATAVAAAIPTGLTQSHMHRHLRLGDKKKDSQRQRIARTAREHHYTKRLPNYWAAANGVTNRSLRGVWPPFLKIGL